VYAAGAVVTGFSGSACEHAVGDVRAGAGGCGTKLTRALLSRDFRALYHQLLAPHVALASRQAVQQGAAQSFRQLRSIRASLTERYELGELLGQGCMAKVYRAHDRVRNISVALKQLNVSAHAPERASVAALFEREFRTLAQLQHPNVIAVYDYGLPADAGPILWSSWTALAAHYPGWVPYLHNARALFELVRGDFNAALRGFETAIAQTGLDEAGRSKNILAWIHAQTGSVEARVPTEQLTAARDRGRAAVELCRKLEIVSVIDEILRTCALAEAKLGNFEGALVEIKALANDQRALGITGLKLGLTYETCAHRDRQRRRRPVRTLRTPDRARIPPRRGLSARRSLRRADQ
jgi:hypothetical protein